MYPGALLAQECCSYQATTQLLLALRGNLAVLVHSDRDCSNVLPKTGGLLRDGRGDRFFCTNLREDEMVTGQGNAKLARAIELVHGARRPDLLVVLATCPTVMIGDDVRNVARRVARKLGANVVAEQTNGLKPKSPAQVVDELYALLCRGAAPSDGHVERRVNIVGVRLFDDERAEIEATLGAMGLELNVVLAEDASLEDFLAAGRARWNVHPGPALMSTFDAQCAERLGQAAIEVPLPFGLAATEGFFRAIGAATSTPDDVVESALRVRRAAAAESVATFVARAGARARAEKGRPLRVAYNVGSVRSFDLRRLAREELGELPLFEELGFEAKLFIQGPADAANRARVAGVLAALGHAGEFEIFPDPGGLRKHIARGEFDVFFGADFLADELSKLALPLVEKSELRAGYGAVAANAATLEDAAFSRFYDRLRVAPGGDGPRDVR